MRKFRQGDAPVILYSRNGVKLFDFDRDRIIETDDEDLINLLLAMGAVEIPPEIPPVPQDLTEVGERINALSGRVTVVEGRADIRSVGEGLSLSGAGELSATGSGGSVTWNDITGKPDNLATTEDVDAKVFVAEYNVTTAQEIIAFAAAANEPNAPMLVKRGNDYYTVLTVAKQADNKIIIRTFGTLSGKFYMFTYTVTNGSWSSSSYGFQQLLESGANIKTINGQSLLGGGDIPISGGSASWADITNKPADLVRDAAYVHTDENFTAAEKTKLAGLANYDDAALAGRVSAVENAVDAITADAPAALDTLKEVADWIERDTTGTQALIARVAANETALGGHTVGKDVPANAVFTDTVYDDAALSAALSEGLAAKQATLVSGENIKTVNGNSLMGAGNLVVGQDFEVGVEKWCGTYLDEGVTYQVYNKIIKIDALPATAGITNYPHGITGIKQILSVYGFCTNGMMMNAPRQNLQDNITIYQVQKAGNIAIEVGKDRSSFGGFVCMVYAKNN